MNKLLGAGQRHVRRSRSSFGSLIPAVFLVFTLAVTGAWAQDRPPAEKWKISAELSYVLTGGNTSISTFSLGTDFSKKWDKNALTFKTFALRSNNTVKTRTAVGTETDFDVIEEKVGQLVAENYLLSGQYERRLVKKLLGQAGFSWDRNRFAGIASRFMLTAGVGCPWVETKKTILKTEAALTYTLRRFMRDETRSFAGFRLLAFFERKFNEKASFSSQIVFDDNLRRTVDWRLDWTNSLSAPISKRLSLKTSLRALYSNYPALQSIPLYDPAGIPAGLNVLVPLKKLDVFFTNSIVINF